MNHKKRGYLMAVLFLLLLSALILVLVIACAQPEDNLSLINFFLDKDNKPPVLLAVNSVASSIIRLEFDEQVKVYGKSFSPFVARADGKSVYVTLNSSLKGGEKSTLSGRVQDFYGNTTGLEVSVWGFNPNIPKLLINEFTTKGTDDNPDRVELFAMSSGNLGGIALYSGIPNDYDAMYVFQDIVVKKGDFIVVAFVDEEYELDSTNNTKANYFCSSEKRLSNDNGILVLASSPSPGAQILDVVVYSKYRDGQEYFGTNTQKERVQWALSNQSWKGQAIDSSKSTSKRSIARIPVFPTSSSGSSSSLSSASSSALSSAVPIDTDSLDDWFIANYPRKEDGFGKVNTADRY